LGRLESNRRHRQYSGFLAMNNWAANTSNLRQPEITFSIEFIGGSRDGEMIDAIAAPDYVEVPVDAAMNEIYERQSDAPPFVYVQIGYAENETWK
jgi:hypothetical protein